MTDDAPRLDGWPAVGRDASLVSSVADADLPIVSRLFLPLDGAHETHSPWAPLYRWSGHALKAGSRWEVLAPPEDTPAGAYRPVSGTVDAATLGVIVDAVSTLYGTTEVDVVLWDVYADGCDGVGSIPIPAVAGGNRWQDGFHRRARVALESLARFAGEGGTRFPVAVFPFTPGHRDGAFLVAAPGYSDSLFVSGTPELMARLAAGGLELLEARCDDPLPTGD